MSVQPMRVCVTGGAGFIGSTLVDRLLRDGHEVVVFDDLSSGTLDNLTGAMPNIEFHEKDLRDLEAVRAAVQGCEVVFHLAALASVVRSVESPDLVTEVNVGGTLNVLIAARDAGVRRVVFASSSSVYGDTPDLPKHEAMALTPRSPYAASKAAGESYLEAFQASYGLETVAFRFFNVFGPRQSPQSLYAAVVPLFLDALAHERTPVIYGDGEQTRDFTYVEDVADALIKGATAPDATQGAMNLGGGNRISINQLLKEIADVLGVAPRVNYEEARVGDVRDSLADITRARTWLGWDPRTSLSDGLRKIAQSLDGANHTASKQTR